MLTILTTNTGARIEAGKRMALEARTRHRHQANTGPMNTLSSWPRPFAGNTLPRMGRIANHNKDSTLVKLSGGCRGKVACASSIGQRYPASNNEASRTAQPKKATG